ncbi:DEAD/DEAH box helicase [Hirsutella rhossiliensis]|uniref:ATP-dependent DNA helicase n=1 Tax=Hirsutella rhossiliensis TaxID=111463 RepID=A0A9P8SIZ9_9HYPO|nr:DEAD/DEAH box helicase domain-containing protein [Hirsutella rhossiliensis]KAH0962541.1 DEAD/DEAH box helicase domain-containing protein [Hirsutella rhossiliensis]
MDDVDFDSGEELFDNIDNQDLLPSQKRRRHDQDGHDDTASGATKRQRRDASHAALARRILTDKFGYHSFNHQQEAVIGRVLAGENTLVIFPTGAGKSLCYQIPAIAFEELDTTDGSRAPGQSGISIVVSPLIALMKDQVDALQSRGIPVASMNSTKTYEQQQLTRVALQKGQIRLLYCAPERLNNESFIENMKTVPGGVRLVAVDEAHCISEWGHSFRPEYLKVARFAQEINAERVVCLTATATPKVADDVCKAFKVDSSCVFRTSPYRPNLHLYAESVQQKQDKFEKTFAFLKSQPGPTLIYVTLQAQAESLAKDLTHQGFHAEAFHAGMKAEVKLQIQDDFMASKIPIVCATIAFGMGIDKQDIRNIIHWDIPATVEEYTQQIGRAGRDGKASHCMLYICHEDFYIRENFARGDLPSRTSLKALLEDIFDEDAVLLPVDGVIHTNHNAQSKDFDIRLSPLSIIYASLELRFGLIRAITPQFTQYSFEATSKYYPSLKADKSEEGKAIFSNARKAAKYHHIDVSGVARATGLLRADLVRKLNQLEERECIRLKASGIEHRYRILRSLPSTDGAIVKLVDELYADLEFREEEVMRRVQQMADLITGTKCFALALAEHFGMKLPDGKRNCGHCTFCLLGWPVVLPPKPPKAVDRAGMERILQACDVRDDPRFLARVAFGIKSPRVTQLKLDRSPVFRSLADHDFKTLLKEFTAACEEAGADSRR